jgi:hypothetical protein
MVRLNEIRAGESVVEIDLPTDAAIVFVGRIHTPWTDRLACPRQGREDGPTCRIQVFEPLTESQSTSAWRCSTGYTSRVAIWFVRARATTASPAAHSHSARPRARIRSEHKL